MSLNLKALLKKPQRSQFRTPFKTPEPSSSLSSSSFKIPSLTLSNGSSKKRSSKSLSPDSLVLPPRKIQHKDVEAHIEKEEEVQDVGIKMKAKDAGGVCKETPESVSVPLPPSPEETPAPVSRARPGETPGGSGDSTHVSESPSWGPSPSQSVSVIETSQLADLVEEEEEEEVLQYDGGANFEMDLSDLDKEYPINPQPEPEPEKPYGHMEDKDFQEDCEEDYLTPGQQELVTSTVPSKVSFTIKDLNS